MFLQSESPCCLSELRDVLAVRESLLSIRATSCAYRESLLSIRATRCSSSQRVTVVYESGLVMLGTHSLQAFQLVQIAVDTCILIPTFFLIVRSF